MLLPDETSIARTARAAHAGSRVAFGDLVDHFERPLYRFLRIRTGHRDDAEELVQEAFLRAWARLECYDPSRPFGNWLFTIGARLAASRARREREAVADDHTLAAISAPDARELQIDDRDEERNLWRIAADVLGPEQRGALWLRYAEDKTPEEVGRIIGKCTVTTRVLLHRARKRLTLHLQELEELSLRHSVSPVAPMKVAAALPRASHAGGST